MLVTVINDEIHQTNAHVDIHRQGGDDIAVTWQREVAMKALVK